MSHAFLTVAIPFEGARATAVEQYLNELGNPPSQSIKDRLDRAAFVHFMSMSVVRGDGTSPAYIIVEVNADGTVGEVTKKLAATIEAELSGALGRAGVDLGGGSLAAFLERHHQGVGQGWFSTPGVNFDGTPGMTVGQILREEKLAFEVGEMLDRMRFDTALGTLTAVRDQLWNDESTKWAFITAPAPSLDPMPPSSRAWLPIIWSTVTNFLWPFVVLEVLIFLAAWGLAGFSLAGFSVAAWITLFVLIAGLGLALAVYLALRRAEEADIPEDIPPSPKLVAEYMKREGHAFQSHLAATSIVKPGFLRRLTLRFGLWFAGILAAHFSRPGFLGSTGVIHFARWIVLPGSNKLLFMSNYDGVWESYLEDFIERAREGVTGIWSNTVGFPKSERLIFKGAADGDRLRRWTRRQQHPTWFWYTAYPRLTLNRIRVNAAIRQGISQAKTEADAADWLACFGAETRLPDTLETSEIPTLAFGGLGRLAYSKCLIVQLSANVGEAKAWLAELEPLIAYGDTRAATEAVVAGVSTSGLLKLGLTDDDMETFPLAFQHGSTVQWRASALGDTGHNDPKTWLWGGPGNEADVVILLYARNQPALDAMAASQRKLAGNYSHRIIHELDLTPLSTKSRDETAPPREGAASREASASRDGSPVRVREPFGFADGISQPRIRGVNRVSEDDKIHVVHPGEFILGYPDNLGYLPPSPSVPAEADPDNILPALGTDPFRQRPRFIPVAPDARHDLGQNGSFLVVRQLEQHRKAFATFLQDEAARLTKEKRVEAIRGPALEHWIAAKMVGRWKDGSSLVRNPVESATDSRRTLSPGAPPRDLRPDNDFLFGPEDPTGLKCPLGAHIRRANPRETFVPGSPEQLAITNRHRILRVGRPYGSDASAEAGLLFACLNTDIDRQFGFVQQTWALAPSFHGLEAEVDPFVGSSPHRDRFTIPTPDGPLRLKGLKDFVTVKGGAYFFLPGRRAVRFLCSAGTGRGTP